VAKLEAPRSYIEASQKEREAVVSGCGPDGASSLVPENILGLRVAESCNIHDWEYSMGDDIRSCIDARFYRNMLSTIEERGGLLLHPRRWIAFWYYRVIINAGSHFYGG
jgi:hypothetical protein